jgi:hypothetical protein
MKFSPMILHIIITIWFQSNQQQQDVHHHHIIGWMKVTLNSPVITFLSSVGLQNILSTDVVNTLTLTSWLQDFSIHGMDILNVSHKVALLWPSWQMTCSQIITWVLGFIWAKPLYNFMKMWSCSINHVRQSNCSHFTLYLHRTSFSVRHDLIPSSMLKSPLQILTLPWHQTCSFK